MPILAQPFLGLPGGMNTALPSHELPPTQARYMQDIILHRPGMIQRRGLLAKISGSATVPFRATGMVMVQDMSGAYRYAILAGSAAAANFYMYNAALTSTTTYALPSFLAFDPAVPRYIVSTSPGVQGGTFVGVSNQYTASTSANAGLFYWRGVVSSDVLTTVTTTPITPGSTSFTVASAAGIVPGMFVMTTTGPECWLGTVKSVSGTTITLEEPSWNATNVGTGGSNTLQFRPVRPFILRVGKGRITTNTNSTIVLGTQGPGGTKFMSQLSNSTILGNLYRLSDGALVGGCFTADDESTLELTANAAINMTDERYYIVLSGDKAALGGAVSMNILDDSGLGFSYQPYGQTPGFLVAQWNNRQWYANKPYASPGVDYAGRLWFSDTAHPEMLDLSKDGDWISVQSASKVHAPITAIQATSAGLAVLKDEELFVVRGTDPTNFTLQKIADVGTVFGGAVLPWNNGIIWPSDNSIFYFDGSHLKDLTPQLGDWYTEALKNFNPSTDRAAAVIYKDHYIVYFDKFQSNIPVQSSSTNTWSKLTLVVNLDTGAVSTWTNTAIKGSVMPPAGAGRTPMFIVDDGGSPGTTSLVDIAPMFLTNTSGTADSITCGGWSGTFPDFYIETQKYSLGEPERKKMFKQLAMTYIANGGTLSIATIPGLNDVGTVSASTFPASTTFINRRIKFLKRDTQMAFRLFGTSSNLVDVQVGPFELGYKWMRVGRV